jgi:HPt (histidine-containing phosphotransfer) domain-containing protein
MDDCLAKPFDEAALLTKMLAVRKAPAFNAAPLFNLGRLYEMAHGKLDFVQRILELFMTSTPTLIDKLQKASSTADWIAAARYAHQLKPTLKLFQVESLLKAIQILEGTTAPDTSRRAATQLLLDTLPKLLSQIGQHVNLLLPVTAAPSSPN